LRHALLPRSEWNTELPALIFSKTFPSLLPARETDGLSVGESGPLFHMHRT